MAMFMAVRAAFSCARTLSWSCSCGGSMPCTQGMGEMGAQQWGWIRWGLCECVWTEQTWKLRGAVLLRTAGCPIVVLGTRELWLCLHVGLTVVIAPPFNIWICAAVQQGQHTNWVQAVPASTWAR